MDRVQFTFAVLLNFISLSQYVLGEAVAYFPSEARASNQFDVIRPYYEPVSRYSMPEHMWKQRRVLSRPVVTQDQIPNELITPVLHKGATDLNPPSVPETPMEVLNYTSESPSNLDGEALFRASKPGYDYQAHSGSYPSAPSYSYTAPTTGYKPPTPSSYNQAPAQQNYGSSAPSPPSNKFPILKPDLTSLIKPVTTKVATKVSGLIGLVLSLLTGTAPDDLEMRGFKDIIINGIVRPLLIAKGGIKSLISKLTIPVISLLLINLEVLITVWWLWEECPESSQPTYTQPAYTPPYNSYT